MLSVSEASEKEILHCVLRIIIEKILHCVQNDKAVRKASLRSRRMTKRISLGMTTYVMLSVSEASERKILHCVQNDKAGEASE